MYWPHGVPRIYAVNGPGNPLERNEREDANEGERERAFSSTSGRVGRQKGGRLGEDGLVTDEKEDVGNGVEGIENGSGNEEKSAEEDEIDEVLRDRSIVELRVARMGHLFTTMTKSSLAVWQTRPTAVVAVANRSRSSISSYGPNVDLLLRPDSAVAIVQTSKGYLITYSITTDPSNRVYQQHFDQARSRRQSLSKHLGIDDDYGIMPVQLRFRMVIKVDAGIAKALAMDNELIVATVKPAAIQCIKWIPDKTGPQTRTESLGKMGWIAKGTNVTEMLYDRAMNLLVWVASDGKAYTVQRLATEESTTSQNTEERRKLFRGYCFHDPKTPEQAARKVAINARFSLVAVSCANGEILVYTARDYVGNIPLSHKLTPPASLNTTGQITFLSYSPDGYCLFTGFENGWSIWSVFGKAGGSSFLSERHMAEANDEKWLNGTIAGGWISGGSEILVVAPDDPRIWVLETARSAITGCFTSANLARALLQTGTEVIIYRGHDLPDLTTISGEASLWHHAQYPQTYLLNQWPVRSCSISQDGRYVAIAGRRGLAHYSVNSGRWKTFDDPSVENSFAVRGGMCWYGHILIAAVESNGSHELRLYSREAPLNNSSIVHVEALPSPAVFIGPSGEDSLLVYTYDNVLYHYVIDITPEGMHLVPVGQIAFHGIVRAPARVRAMSWVLPDNQLRSGDPSQDVAVASVLFLVNGELVLLQPTQSEDGGLRYDMRVIAHDVEYYILMRDQLAFNFAPPPDESVPPTPSAESAMGTTASEYSPRDSLWIFSKGELSVWNNVQDVLLTAAEGPIDVLPALPIVVDFYPLSILLNKGVILGIEPEISQRRDVPFTNLRFAIRTHLFLPYLLRHYLSQLDTHAALSLSHQYSNLSYFHHALEVVLHNVLDDEVDQNGSHGYPSHGDPSSYPPNSLLAIVISFLQTSFPPQVWLDIIVQCTRKTELRSWRTLYAYLPPPTDLFEHALRLNLIKLAAGYLLVLQAFDEEEGGEERTVSYVVRLLRLALSKGDVELCKELAQFLMALDPSGSMLRDAVTRIGLRDSANNRATTLTHFRDGYPRDATSSRSKSGSSIDHGLGLTIPAIDSRGRLKKRDMSAASAASSLASSSSVGSMRSQGSIGSGSDAATMSPGADASSSGPEYTEEFAVSPAGSVAGSIAVGGNNSPATRSQEDYFAALRLEERGRS